MKAPRPTRRPISEIMVLDATSQIESPAIVRIRADVMIVIALFERAVRVALRGWCFPRCSKNGDMSFLVKALNEIRQHKDEISETFNPSLPAKSLNEMEQTYLFIYLSGGVLHMLTEWVMEENRTPVDEIAPIAARFIENSCSLDC